MNRFFLSTFLLSMSLLSVTFGTQAAENDLTREDIKTYYTALENHKVAELSAFYAKGIVYEDVATGDIVKGNTKATAYVKSFLESSANLKVKATKIVFDTDSASVEWLMSAGSGKDAWSVRGASIIEHNNGLITRVSDYWNN